MKQVFMQWLGISPKESETPEIDLNRASATLMAEVMAADDQVDEREKQHVFQVLTENFSLSELEAKDVLDEVIGSHAERNDLYAFTRVINQQADQDTKFELLKNLWRVAYADGEVAPYEAHMIRKIADLIHLHHSQFIRAKIEARPADFDA